MHMSGPLLDRMEVIRLPHSTISRQAEYCPALLGAEAQTKNNGLKPEELSIADEAVIDSFHTRKQVCVVWKREIFRIARKVVKEQSLDADGKQLRKIETSQSKSDIREHDSGSDQLSLITAAFASLVMGVLEEKDQVGITTGLA